MKTLPAVLALAVFAHLAAHAVNQIPDLSISGPEVAMIGGSTNFTLYCENIDEMEIDKIVVACTDGTRWTNDNPSQTTFSWPFTYSPAAPGVYAMEAELWYDTASCHDFDSLHTVTSQFRGLLDVDPTVRQQFYVNEPVVFLCKASNSAVSISSLVPPNGWSYNSAKAGWIRTNIYYTTGTKTESVSHTFLWASPISKAVGVFDRPTASISPTTIKCPNKQYTYTVQATGGVTPLTYNWIGSDTPSTTTTADYTMPRDQQTTMIRCEVRDGLNTLYTATNVVTIYQVTSVSANKSAMGHDSANNTATFTVSPSPPDDGSIEWMRSTDNGATWSAVTGDDASIVLPSTEPPGKYIYKARAEGSSGSYAASPSPVTIFDIDTLTAARPGNQGSAEANASSPQAELDVTLYHNAAFQINLAATATPVPSEFLAQIFWRVDGPNNYLQTGTFGTAPQLSLQPVGNEDYIVRAGIDLNGDSIFDITEATRTITNDVALDLMSVTVDGDDVVLPGDDTDYTCVVYPSGHSYHYTWEGTEESSSDTATLNTQTNVTVKCTVYETGYQDEPFSDSLDVTVLAVQWVSASPVAIGYCGPSSITVNAVLNKTPPAGAAVEWQYKVNAGNWIATNTTGLTLAVPSNSPPAVYQFRARVQGALGNWAESPSAYVVAITNLTLADERFPTNGVTTTPEAIQMFCIAELTNGTARLNLTGTTVPASLPSETAAQVLWFVTNAAVQNAAGVLNSNVCVLTPDVTAEYARIYTAFAGFDTDGNGLAPNEYQISNTIAVVKIAYLTISDTSNALNSTIVSNGFPAPAILIQEHAGSHGFLALQAGTLPDSIPQDNTSGFHYAVSGEGQVVANGHLSDFPTNLVLDTLACPSRIFVIDAGWDANNDETLDAFEDSMVVTVQFPRITLAVDGNRDGIVSFTDPADRSIRFWLNDDQDMEADAIFYYTDRKEPETIPAKVADNVDNLILSPRDLEDFARLHLRVEPASCLPLLQSGTIRVGFRWRTQVADAPSLRLFANASPNGDWDYIRNIKAANVLINPINCLRPLIADDRSAPDGGTNTVVTETTFLPLANFVFPSNYWNCATNHFLIFEGLKEGRGELEPIFIYENEALGWLGIVGCGDPVTIEIRNIEHFYQRYHSTPDDENFPYPFDVPLKHLPDPYMYPPGDSNTFVVNENNLSYASGFDPEDGTTRPNPDFMPAADEDPSKCIVFVHGIQMSVDEVKCYAESFYKRLWWEGYCGRFIVFRWSTNHELPGLFKDHDTHWPTYKFNLGEFLAWESGVGLQKFVANLRNQMRNATISIAAHSLGNVVAGSALKHGMNVDNYVMLEAAASSSLFYPLTESSRDPMDKALVPELVKAEEGRQTPFDYTSNGYRGYLADIKANVKDKWCNYYSTNDFWLRTGVAVPLWYTSFQVNWVKNNLKCKPNSWEYEYRADTQTGPKCFQDCWGYDRGVVDEHETMSFISRSRTYPVGGDGIQPKVPRVTAVCDLAAEYHFGTERKDHSGQFQRDIQTMYDFGDKKKSEPLYRRLLTDLNVAPSPPPKKQP